MSVTVQGPDGNSYQFPDGTDKAAAISYFKKKGIGAKSTPQSGIPHGTIGPMSMKDQLTTLWEPTSSMTSAEKAGRFVSNIGAGGLGVLLHPLKTLEGVGSAVLNPAEAIRSTYESLNTEPQSTAAGMIGQTGATAGVGKVLGKVAGPVVDVAKATIPRTLRSITHTGPQVAQDLVAKTAEENAGKVAKATEANTKAQGIQAERTRLQTLAGKHAEELRGRIETAREKALKVGNEQYNAVNETLNPLRGDMEKIGDVYGAASESIGDAGAQPAILTRLGKSIEHGEQLTYKDEQGLYSELGKELSKGTLSGRVYHAYDMLHDALGDDMQRMADSQGMGEQLSAARSYWKRMKQTFGKPPSVRDAATKTMRSVAPEFAREEDLTNRVRLLSHYDPEIGNVSKGVTEARQGLKSLPKVNPIPAEADITKLTPASVSQAKAAKALDTADKVRNSSGHLATVFVALDAIRRLLHGDVAGLGIDVGARGVYAMGKNAFASALADPKVVNALSQLTPEDIEQVMRLPADQREGFDGLLEAAKKKGVNIPGARIGTAIGPASSQKRVAAALQPQ